MNFSNEEMTVYKTLLSGGPISVSNIVRKTHYHRPAVYRLLALLIEKGLVSVMPKGKYKVYVAQSPQRLEELFTKIQDSFSSEIEDLYDAYNARSKKPVITYDEGDDSIRKVFSDVVHSLKKDDAYYRYSSRLTPAREKFLPKDYRKIRDTKNLERYIITDETSGKTMSKRIGKEYRIIPKGVDLFDLDVSQIIYADKVAFIDYNSKTTITIESEFIAQFQKKLFKLLYSKL